MGAVSRYGPPLALMGLIFVLSAQPDLDSGLAWDFTLRKVGHAAVYGTLFVLWRRALPDVPAAVAAAISVAYAISDEYHQTFVTGRTGTVRDVLVDAAGVTIAWLLSTRLLAQRSG